jgi:hypothetical protein
VDSVECLLSTHKKGYRKEFRQIDVSFEIDVKWSISRDYPRKGHRKERRVYRHQQRDKSVNEKEPMMIVPIDVNLLTLGIETAGGFIINHQEVPDLLNRCRQPFIVLIQELTGERSLSKDNTLLVKFEISKIRPACHGVL